MTPPAARPGPPDSWDEADEQPRSWARIAFRRIFGDGENLLDWAAPMGSIAGVRVRIHLFFLVFIVARMLWSISRDSFGPGYMALSLAILVALVVAHELGHCVVCRAVGGEAEEVVLWPLGGLAPCDAPPLWRAQLLTALAGPALHVAILPLTSAALAAIGAPVLFNPLRVGLYLAQPRFDAWWTIALGWTHVLNALLLLFNLLPMLPLDGGRALEALLWRSAGRRGAAERTLQIGFLLAGVLGVGALASDHGMILGVAVFCALYCWIEWQRLRAVETLADPAFARAAWLSLSEDDSPPVETPSERRERLRQEREARQQQEVDRILAKIAKHGMRSLTRAERRTLRAATKRKRQG
ncbi:MAG: hypothetical protein D6824_04195 [Planctomycetota bacterium]|nr:MAG: hypothetical protein D6824_04195 [Planctomycetota bacterium]